MSNGRAELDGKLYGPGFDGSGHGGPLAPAGIGALKQRLIIPPFSVLNTRDDVWIKRRRGWLKLGIQSEVGRDAVAYHQESLNNLGQKMRNQAYAGLTRIPGKGMMGGDGKPTTRNKAMGGSDALSAGGYKDADGRPVSSDAGANGIATGTSIFDPVLCELAYTWWCPPAGIVIDPFAGGSVRGIVASVLGLKYWGCDLRPEQVAANKAQLNARTCGQYKPRWVCGDSYDRLPEAPMADFILSCPPYGSLERYSDDPADISTMPYGACVARYAAIIARAAARLRPDRFACLVVANYRDAALDGKLRHFVGDTITACEAAGLAFYNDAILVNSVGTGAMRTNTNFARGARKLVKLHQNVLVFVKGDPKLAAAACGPAPDGKDE